MDAGELGIITSTIALTETLVHPLCNGDTTLMTSYQNLLLDTEGITAFLVTEDVAQKAAELRAIYRLRTPDAIHLATALVHGARFFITNDEGISGPPEITIVVLQHVLITP